MKQIFKFYIFLVSAILLTGCGEQEVQNKMIETYSYEEDKAVYILENDNLKFTLDSDTTYFEVTDKKTNIIWHSNPMDGANDVVADAESIKYLQSTLLAKYSTDTGIQATYSNYEYSIAKQIYEIEEGKDYIKVKYSIGDVKKTYVLPSAIPISRMNVFTDQMDNKQLKQINSYYRIYDINNLRATDDKAELLAKYPDLETENIYVIRDNLQDYLLKKIEDVFTNAGYTLEDYEEDSNRYSKNNDDEKPFFNISVIYRLEDNDLVIELPFEEMEWRDIYPLTEVSILPFFGAGSTQDNGFLLVPEGNGGIINFNNKRNEQSIYYAEVYGWDNAMKRDAVINESRTAFPVFGIAKNGSSMLCMIEDNSAVSTITADVSGRKHSYNYVNASFTILHSASVQVSAKSDKSVMVYESKKPEGVIKQRYRFLDTDQYAKMAESYREYLMKKYPELEKNEEAGTPVHITLVGAIDAVKQRFGFPVSVPIPLTTYQEAYEILKELKEYGYGNLSVTYSGWMNGGVKQSVLDRIKTIKELGSKNELKKYLDYGNEQDIKIYLEGITGYAYNKSIFDGFVEIRDTAKYASREIVKLYDFSPVWYGEEDWNDCYYLLKPQNTIDYMQKLADYTKEYAAKGAAFRDIGYYISGDYNPKNLITRQEAVAMQKEALQGMVLEGVGVVVNGGNDYVLPYVDYITDMNLGQNQFQIIDYNVPFYSMAIHGLVDYSAGAVNLSGDYQDTILKSAEAGAGLSFTFMKEPVSTLQNTNYTNYFGADYDKWKEEAYKIYNRYEAELGHCFNQYIMEHERLEDGVFVTGYEDGTRVYVNYNDKDYVVGGLMVPAHDYKVEKR